MSNQATTPNGFIAFLINKEHIGHSDDYIEALIRERFEPVSEQAVLDQGFTKRSAKGWVNRCVKYALKVHHDNQGLFQRYRF